ncbi:MAG: two-component sensor histidine kinase [Desulfobulbaceae bacterium]|uniref:histidine kinase n=1 Tax=Candidatus Desulfobia pelagia TaxID=2841692 RepID=A0A8J6TC98_9BACT|nr:two-component sensor histidine kinase [Candidatus Desulfobia pelagia]
MSLLNWLKPEFWDYKASDKGPFEYHFHFRSMWKKRILLLALAAFGPFSCLAIFDYLVTKHYAEKEIHLRTAQIVSSTTRTVSFYLNQRKTALDLISRPYSFEEISSDQNLLDIFHSLKRTIGGFSDVGIINSSGEQVGYVGYYDLKGDNYAQETWFAETVAQGSYISEVFLGHRNIPHMIIAIKHDQTDGSFYLLRATIDTESFNQLLSQTDLEGTGDAFLINHAGIIQTPTLSHGNILEKSPFPVPPYSEKVRVNETTAPHDKIIYGYAHIPGTPYTTLILGHKSELMAPWLKTRFIVIVFILISILFIMFIVHALATRLVNEIYTTDKERILTLREVAHTNKLASIGRLAAGVAHEINNPLAIINEKAGLMKDILSFSSKYSGDQKLVGSIDSILNSVERCGTITKRLLGFARHLDVKLQPIDIKAVIEDVLGFLGKEAEYRSINVNIEVESDIAIFKTDRGKVQQIFLNLINNSFAAMSDGGHLNIKIIHHDNDFIAVSVEDDGCGIPQADLERIFEPFFSTKTKIGGTGLGLPITFGLAKELGGDIKVESTFGKGTKFTVYLPLTPKEPKEKQED